MSQASEAGHPSLPETKTIALGLDAAVLQVTLNRPDRRNAMSAQMVDELIAAFDATRAMPELRAIVLRGAGGNFSAGADIKSMPSAREGGGPERAEDPKAAAARANRRFGDLMSAAQATSAPVIALVEGAVMGGGFGLVCVSDVSIAMTDARFGLPETGLGLIPAQIAPFVEQRIGLTQARRLMLTGARFDGAEALRIGLVHELVGNVAELDARLAAVLGQIRRCAPRANAATKRLLLESLGRPLGEVLDEAARVFAEASVSDEAREGTQAFVQKRLPKWAE